jgi:hypothetical protein
MGRECIGSSHLAQRLLHWKAVYTDENASDLCFSDIRTEMKKDLNVFLGDIVVVLISLSVLIRACTGERHLLPMLSA